MTGYSATSLAAKLGIKEGSEVVLVGAPDGLRERLEPLPPRVEFADRPSPATSIVHLFTTRRAELAEALATYPGRPSIAGSISSLSDDNVFMRRAETPLYVRLLAGLVEPFPDFDFRFIKPVRRRAVALLRLRPGARVLDAGCGSGGSFPSLVQAVGSRGKVVGVELSADSAAHAIRRAKRNDWRNVDVLVAAAETVALTGSFDGLLMFAAPDVYASEASLDRLLPHLAKGGRVVFFGGKKSTRRFGWLLNGLLNFALTRLSLPTTPGLEAEPWRRIAARVCDLEVHEYFHGWMFLASGTVRPDA